MNRVVLDVSMSLDGFTAGPNMREAEPIGTAANASLSFTVIGGRCGGSDQSEEAHDGQGVHPHDDVAGWVHRGSE